MNTLSNFKVEELEQRLEMAQWNSEVKWPDETIYYPDPKLPIDSSILK